MRTEFAAIGVAFDMMPQISTTGVFSTIFNQQANVTLTLPGLPGTLAMLSDVATETAARTSADTANATAIATETGRATAAENANAAAIALRAPLASPTFTGTVTVPTPGTVDHSTKAVNSGWVSDFLAASGFAPTGASPVVSVAGRTGAVNLTHADLTDWVATLAPYALTSALAPYAPIVSIPPLLRGFLGGLGLSIDGVSPLLVLDIAAGTCTDSTNTTTITLGAFTKSIGGVWTAGSGNNGMGVGVVATALTWYHVFAAIVAGVPDVFFDAGPNAANRPASTTAFRRIGSFKLDAATHIQPFIQTADRFDRIFPNPEFSGASATTAAVTMTLGSTPPGVVTHVLLTGSGSESVTGTDLYLSALAQADVVPGPTTALTMRCPLNTTNSFFAMVPTNTSQQIRRRSSSVSQTLNILTNGYIDTRGRG
jgi:hypothetical protein